ncbi:hypothetical protein Bca52824_003184 [Brassica carinata]|uniref:Uncharacterized protein n=1 Tax=Brassica carinata TaxID=52824 RepID=A0A8X8BB81_BRACI|nr:hypothetical protein Bca52824_003184 [Brassica carinata]
MHILLVSGFGVVLSGGGRERVSLMKLLSSSSVGGTNALNGLGVVMKLSSASEVPLGLASILDDALPCLSQLELIGTAQASHQKTMHAYATESGKKQNRVRGLQPWRSHVLTTSFNASSVTMVYGTARRFVAYRPAMLSMVAIAAVCVCVALLFKSYPEVIYVFQPLRWELLDYRTR